MSLFHRLVSQISYRLLSLLPRDQVIDDFQIQYDVDFSAREYGFQPSALESVMKRLGYFPKEVVIREISRRFKVSLVDEAKKERHIDSVPSILLATMPKSASSFVTESLRESFALDHFKVDDGPFPYAHIRARQLLELRYGNCIASDHFAATAVNLEYLQKSGQKVFVHHRDPRDALNSWVHYLQKYDQHQNDYDSSYNLFFIYPSLPDDYFDRSFSAQLDYQIDIFFKDCIAWAESWVQAHSLLTDQRICFGSMNEMTDDPLAYLERISDFFGYSREYFEKLAVIEREKHANFRAGLHGGWRNTFSSEQIERVNQLIPDEHFKFFGWQRGDPVRSNAKS